MATKERKQDAFKALRPKKDFVLVGEHELILKTATLDQEARFLEVVEDLELEKLALPVINMIKDPNDSSDDQIFIKKIANSGPEVWKSARTVLGKQFAPTVRKASVALLDSVENKDLLESASLIQSPEIDTGSDGEYLGSPDVRKFIKSNLTLLQGIKVVSTAWSINGYSEVAGNMIAPLVTTEQ